MSAAAGQGKSGSSGENPGDSDGNNQGAKSEQKAADNSQSDSNSQKSSSKKSSKSKSSKSGKQKSGSKAASATSAAASKQKGGKKGSGKSPSSGRSQEAGNQAGNGQSSGKQGLKKSRGVASMILGVPLADRIKGISNEGRTKKTQEKSKPKEEKSAQVAAQNRTGRENPVGHLEHPELSPAEKGMVRDYFKNLRDQSVKKKENQS